MFKKLTHISQSPGIYIFRRGANVLSIGKAFNLKKRVASYFQHRLGLPVKIRKMLEESTRVETIGARSDVEALIMEAELIKRHRPKYNILMRDDKNYFFVGITSEPYPRLFISHQTPGVIRRSGGEYRVRYIGPFTSGDTLKTVLKLLRRVFPYCTCTGAHRRPCLNSQIGRCPGYCCRADVPPNQRTAMLRAEYRRGVRRIAAVLGGKRTRLGAELKRRLVAAAKSERYEEAARMRDQIRGLEDIFSHRGVILERAASASWPALAGELGRLLGARALISRIEGYDISDISGTAATGSMVVFVEGVSDKRQYRKFRIKTVARPNDTAMLAEVLRRRLAHAEWPRPELMVIDGGKGQLAAARRVLGEDLSRSSILVSALAKREEILQTPSKTIFLKREQPAVLHLFQRIRDESHRFARTYHHKLRELSYRHAAASAKDES